MMKHFFAHMHSAPRLLLYLTAATVFLMLQIVADQASRAWVNPTHAEEQDPDFLLQGEYLVSAGEMYGAQVVALGHGAFDAYLHRGGLPGQGWDPQGKKLKLQGKAEAGRCICLSASGKTKMIIENGKITLEKQDGKQFSLSRITRTSPTLGAKAPVNAVMLFDGGSADAWTNGKTENGLLAATGATSKQTFGSYHLHLEFRTPYKPDARGQQRGNSGIYHSGRWETQILDSFGLNVQQNECGGIYSIATPSLNMCLPPLAWQTYDVDFACATFDKEGKRLTWPRITVRLNGVIIHENIELAKDFTTSAPLSTVLTTAKGPVHLQDHGNPVMFQNIWIIEK